MQRNFEGGVSNFMNIGSNNGEQRAGKEKPENQFKDKKIDHEPINEQDFEDGSSSFVNFRSGDGEQEDVKKKTEKQPKDQKISNNVNFYYL